MFVHFCTKLAVFLPVSPPCCSIDKETVTRAQTSGTAQSWTFSFQIWSYIYLFFLYKALSLRYFVMPTKIDEYKSSNSIMRKLRLKKLMCLIKLFAWFCIEGKNQTQALDPSFLALCFSHYTGHHDWVHPQLFLEHFSEMVQKSKPG